MFAKIKSWASKLKQHVQILQVVYQDDRTPFKAKLLIWITLGYLFSPIDLIPDFIPVLGLLDDLIIVPLLITLAIKMIPKTVWNWAEAQVKNQAPRKWKVNWSVVIFICLAWLSCFYLLYEFIDLQYFKQWTARG